MFTWIANNAVTLIVIAVLMIIIGIAVFILIKEKKSGKGNCTGDCSCCGAKCSYKK